MNFNSEDEIRAFFAGRRHEAAVWAYWQDGIQWCGRSDPRSLQDVLADLTLEEALLLAIFRRNEIPA